MATLLRCAAVYFTAVLLSGTWADEVKVKAIEGKSVTLENRGTRHDAKDHIIWTFGPEQPNITIATMDNREVRTDYSEHFRDRLHLESQTGSATITNLSVSDCGFYWVQSIGRYIKSRRFHLSVYRSVSSPSIKVNASLFNETCSLLTAECSVENGRDLILSWYKGRKKLIKISNSNLSTSLVLRLEIKYRDGDNYSCVAENPVDQKANELHAQETCVQNGESTSWCQTEVTVRVVVAALVSVVLIVITVDYFTPRKCT